MILRFCLFLLLTSPCALAQTIEIRAGNLIDPATGKVTPTAHAQDSMHSLQDIEEQIKLGLERRLANTKK